MKIIYWDSTKIFVSNRILICQWVKILATYSQSHKALVVPNWVIINLYIGVFPARFWILGKVWRLNKRVRPMECHIALRFWACNQSQYQSQENAAADSDPVDTRGMCGVADFKRIYQYATTTDWEWTCCEKDNQNQCATETWRDEASKYNALCDV